MRFTLPVAAALLAVYVFWGGTYLAIKFAVETLPPFITAGVRFMAAGAIMYVWQAARGVERPQAVHWKSAAIVGGLMLLCGNGGVVWSEQMVPSGIAAIIIASVPLWMALLAWLWQGGSRPGVMVFLGLALGFAGIALLVANSGVHVSNSLSQWRGYAVLVSSSLFWAVGSLYSRVAKLPHSPLMAIAMQMLAGGLFCLLFGLVTGEWSRLDLAQVSMRSMLSLGYLVFFGSIIGFSAYIWLLKAADPTTVSTYAYVNPVVAVILGWALAGERFTTQDALAAAIIVLSAVIITRASGRKTAAPRQGELKTPDPAGLDGGGI